MSAENTQEAIDNGQWAMNKEPAVINDHPMVVKIFAHLFSYIFHPLFIPLYAVCFLVYYHPSYFSGFNPYDKYKLVLTTVLNTVFFPAFAVLLMKGLGFIQSIFLRTQPDRIGPYLATMIFYFWAARVFFKFEPQLAPVLPSFMTGVLITTVVGLLSNIYFKISMHAMGVGGLVGLFLLVMQSNSMLMTWPLCIALLMAGLVCTSRLVVSDHQPREIYLGLLAGLLCQFTAAMVIL